MSYLELYKKRMNRDMGDVLDIRTKIGEDAINRNFKKAHGYKLASLMREIGYVSEDIDIVVNSKTSELEKSFELRPNTEVGVGSYISYDNKTYIIREVNYDSLNPSAYGFYCNQKINFKNIEYDFPCYTNSTTYGSKGILDQTKFYELDSKTKIYIQKNKYTDKIKIGQRVMFDNRYLYKITEIDDLVFKGMFTAVAQRDESMPMDDFENNVAWNEYEEDVPENVVSEIKGDEKVKLGNTGVYTTDIEDANWNIDDESIATIIECSGNSVTVKFNKRGWFTLSCNDKVSLDVMVC